MLLAPLVKHEAGGICLNDFAPTGERTLRTAAALSHSHAMQIMLPINLIGKTLLYE